MPTATDLVTDLPADFEVFGQAVATSMADLLGGTSGQILAKNSNTDMDFVWIANDQGDITGITASSPLTGGGTSGAITVGIQDGTTAQKGAVQLENSTSSTSTTTAAVPASVKSAYDLADGAIAKTTVTTAGDIIYRNATVPTRLGIGTANQVLRVNSGATAPEWATVSTSPTFVGALASTRATQTLSNNTMTAISLATEIYDTNGFHSNVTNNSRFTIPSGKDGTYLFFATGGTDYYTGGLGVRFAKNGTNFSSAYFGFGAPASGLFIGSLTTVISLVAGDYVELVLIQNSGSNKAVAYSGTEDFTFMGCTYLGA